MPAQRCLLHASAWAPQLAANTTMTTTTTKHTLLLPPPPHPPTHPHPPPHTHRHLADNLNIGDAIDYAQASHRGSLGDLVAGTLHALERGGGPDAFHHIKYHVPLYESCCRPSRLARKP